MAVLTAAKRKSLPKSDYIFPDTEEFPIPDEEHGRKALQLMTHQSPARQAAIKRAVHRRYPDIDSDYKMNKKGK